MSHQTYLWIKLVHFVGFIIWLSSIFGLANMLREKTGGSGEARDLLVRLARNAGRAMDAGATFAIVAGVILLIKSPAPIKPIEQPYFHVKLTMVVLLLALHGFLRMRAGKLAKGESKPLGPAPLALTTLLVLGIVGIVLIGPLYLHK
jgi:protoporphyrinogen IX oxidase